MVGTDWLDIHSSLVKRPRTLTPHFSGIPYSTYLLKFICNPLMNVHHSLVDICAHEQSGKRFELLSFIHIPNRSQIRQWSSLYLAYLHIFVPFVADFVFFYMPSQCSIRILPWVPKHKNDTMCLTEKINVLASFKDDL